MKLTIVFIAVAAVSLGLALNFARKLYESEKKRDWDFERFQGIFDKQNAKIKALRAKRKSKGEK